MIETTLKLVPNALTHVKKTYVKPSLEKCSIESIESYGLKLEQLLCDECNFSRILNLERFYEKLINKGLGIFHKPELRRAFGEKIKSSNISLDELEKIMEESRTTDEIARGKTYSFAFINLTNPLKNEVRIQRTTILRPLDFKEAEFVLKNKYTPEEISDFVKLRSRTINSSQIEFEDADIIIKNKPDEDTIKYYLSLRKQHHIEPNKALYASYLRESDVQTISEKEINKFLELKGKKITYQNAEGKTLEYFLPPEEAAYCAKYDFNETQLQRFARLRNEYFAQDSIRNSGIETGFEVKDILEWIKKDVSDTDIFNYNYLLNNPQLFEMVNQKLTKENLRKLYYNICFNKKFKMRPDIENIENNSIMAKIIERIFNDENIFKKQIIGTDKKTDLCKSIKILREEQIKFFEELSQKLSDEKLVFDACIRVIRELKASGNLNEYEMAAANNILSLEYKNEPYQGKKLLHKIINIFVYKIQTPEQIERYKHLIKMGVTEPWHIARDKELYDTIIRLANDESLVYQDFSGNIKRLEINKLAALSQFIDLTKMDIRRLLPDVSKWYKVCTGEKEYVSLVFKAARKLLRKRNKQVTSNLSSSDIERIRKLGGNQTGFYGNYLHLDEHSNLILDLGNNSFRVAIEKTKICGKTVIIIKDLEHNAYYVGYNGAISKIEDLPPINKKHLQRSIVGYSKYSKIQDEIYADAIEHFPVRIIDDKSECIIGKGRPALDINSIALQLTDEELIAHYQRALRILKSTGNLSVENIIRIMPKGATIQINPYTTSKNGKMLYSISAEWESKDGVKWQLRTHSTDLEHYMNSGTETENSDWIFRLGHEVHGEAKFFEYNEAERQFTPTGDFMGASSRSSHVRIPHSPFNNKDNLLNNIHFQNIMRQISM